MTYPIRENNNDDNVLATALQHVTGGNPEFWSFRGRATRDNSHAFFHYPAMMVPEMQSVLLQTFLESIPQINKVYDPFMGSGTVLVETMLKGLDFLGQDINPLAVLLCKSKAGPMDVSALETDCLSLKSSIEKDDSTAVEVTFTTIDKWFRNDVQQALSKIRRAILLIPERWRRRFFWIALAETVRLTSNSRTSNFKLYTYKPEDIQNRQLAPVDTFFQISRRNLEEFSKQRNYLDRKGLLKDNKYLGEIEIRLGDTTEFYGDQSTQLLMTSPPYGDNSTTVTYGQFSYLPLQWISLEDIDEGVDESYLVTASEIDSRSLGGSKANAMERAETLLEISQSFAQIIEDLSDEPPDRAKRVASFFSDLELTLDPILSQMAEHSYMVWIVGNRSVGGRQVPMNQILRETLESKGVELICELEREFPGNTKRMGYLKNTMPTEQILIMRKGT